MSRRRTYQQRLSDCRESTSIVRSGICEVLSVVIRFGLIISLLALVIAPFVYLHPDFVLSVAFASNSFLFALLTASVFVFQEVDDFTKPPAER
jgi:hypothetical protein